MKLEVTSAVDFLTNLLRSRDDITEFQTQNFNSALVNLLCNRYQNHWFPEKPFKGSGYRCIRLNHNMDPLILQAGQTCGLDCSFLESTFPPELTMWVDPSEVSYRIGENGSVGVLYCASSNSSTNENEVQSSPSVSPSVSPLPPSPTVLAGNENFDSTNYHMMSCKEQFMSVIPSLARDTVNYQKFPAYVFS